MSARIGLCFDVLAAICFAWLAVTGYALSYFAAWVIIGTLRARCLAVSASDAIREKRERTWEKFFDELERDRSPATPALKEAYEFYKANFKG